MEQCESGNQLTTMATLKPNPQGCTSWTPPTFPPLPNLTFTEETIPGKARAAGAAVGAGDIEAVGARAALVLVEGAFI